MRPRINTEKHYVQHSQFAVAAGAITNLVIASAKAIPTAANHVREGAVISAVYIEMWLVSDDASFSTSIVTLEKLPGVGATMTAAEAALLNDYQNKKNIFYTQMGLTPGNAQYPLATIRGWFKVPKGKQRMGLDDALVLNILGQSDGLAGCGFMTYKEQF